jgi:hypothetical protein
MAGHEGPWRGRAPRLLPGGTLPLLSPATPTLPAGPHTMVSLLRLLALSAKHLRLDVSTTVSQNDTTGSATLTSTSAGGSEGEEEGGRVFTRRSKPAKRPPVGRPRPSPASPLQRLHPKASASSPLAAAGRRQPPLRTCIHLAEVLHDAVEVELTRAQDGVLARLLDLGCVWWWWWWGGVGGGGVEGGV